MSIYLHGPSTTLPPFCLKQTEVKDRASIIVGSIYPSSIDCRKHLKHAPIKDAELAGKGAIDKFLTQTQSIGIDYSGPDIEVIFRLNPDTLNELDGLRSAVFEAKLETLNERSAIFECAL